MHGRNDDQHKNDGVTNDSRSNNRQHRWSDAQRFERRNCHGDGESSKLSCVNPAKGDAVSRLA